MALATEYNPNGVIVWEGLSLIDRKTPVVCILVGLVDASDNTKTGGLVQSYIIRSDMHPFEAAKSRQDFGLCGNCLHRYDENGVRTCYVNLLHGPRTVWEQFKAGRYERVTPEEAAERMAGGMLRHGSYGDPAAVPVPVWKALQRRAIGWTGYTHQWRSRRFQALRDFCMASCDTPEDVEQARAMGWSTFHVMPSTVEDPPADAFHCIASEEVGKVMQCVDCMACSGTTYEQRDVVIYAHGTSSRRYTGRRALPVLA
jgi:hypothetical protein